MAKHDVELVGQLAKVIASDGTPMDVALWIAAKEVAMQLRDEGLDSAADHVIQRFGFINKLADFTNPI